ncbi:MAG TPA: chaperone modulator CbpM [Steroidobacteraceae bacterium]|nr:chaperone modulator CbpM [Steroidobacteraceae bacterium]
MAQDEDIRGQLLASESLLELSRFGSLCRVEHSLLIEMIEFGVLEPEGDEPASWRLPVSDLLRARRAARLRRDLDINTAGIAVILDLLEQRDQLLARLRRFENLLSE